MQPPALNQCIGMQIYFQDIGAPLTYITEIPALISNYIIQKVWDEITYVFPNFNDATVEV